MECTGFGGPEERLALLLGPVAPRLVTKLSRDASTLDDLCHRLATFIPAREDLKRFLAWSSAELNVSTKREKRRTPPTTTTPPAVWDPAMLERARRDLAVHLGPLARVIVRRVSPRARSREELYELLALEIPDEADREAFRRRGLTDAGHE